MDVPIDLSREDVVALLPHIPEVSKHRSMLEKSGAIKRSSAALQITFASTSLVCSTSEAIHMFSIANHCHEISWKIKKGSSSPVLAANAVDQSNVSASSARGAFLITGIVHELNRQRGL
jgi:hypothetical protein